MANLLKRFQSWFKGRGVDARSFLGTDQAFVDQWRKQREPDKSQLIYEFKGAVYACSQLNVNEVIKPELRLYQRKRTSQKSLYPTKRVRNLESFCKRQKVRLNSGEEIVEITSHPFLWLKDHPNPNASWTEIIEMSQTYLELTGSCYWYLNDNQLGIPGEIWVLPPQWLRPIIIDGVISHYEYIQGVNKVNYSVDEVLSFLLPNPRRPWLDGYSWIYAIYEQLNILDKYNATEAAILDNEGLPKGIIKAKDGLSPEEAIRWEHRYNNKFRRAGAGGVLVLEDDADFTPISWAPRDLARLSVLDNARLSVANAAGVPYEMISEGGSSQYNVDVTIANRHVERAIVPRLRRLQECLNRGLISRYDDSGDLFVAFDDPSPTNQEMERENLKTYVTTGIITPNEARVQLGYEETDWGSLPAGMYNAASTDGAVDPTVEPTEVPEDETGETEVSRPMDEEEPEDEMTEAEPEEEPEPEETETEEPETETEDEPEECDAETIFQIVMAVASGQIPRDAGIGLLVTIAGLTPEEAETVLGSAGKGEQPEAESEPEEPEEETQPEE